MKRPLPTVGARVLLYARYSTKNQDFKSIEGQLSLCRAYAAKYGWIVVGEHHDAERSGTTTVGRSGLFAAMAAVENGECEAFLVEDVDRLSRDAADTHHLARMLEENDVALCSVSNGVIGDMELGFAAIQNQQYVRNNVEKVKRGQRYVVESGRISGSIAFGYAKVHKIDDRAKPINGIWKVDKVGSKIVQRIFLDYDAGVSTIAICSKLNADKVPGPGGKLWRPGALTGSGPYGTGILRNRLYIGEFVWGRTSRKRRQGRMKTRATADTERMVHAHPELAFVERDLFDRVQERVTRAHQYPLNARRKAEYPLSGKFRCTWCGNPCVLLNGRLGCTGRARMGVCENSRRVPREDVEEALFRKLPEHLLVPTLLDHVLEAYRTEAERALAEHAGRQEDHGRRIAEIDQRVANLLQNIGSEASDEQVNQVIKQEIGRLIAEKQRLERDLKNKPRAIGLAMDTDTVIARIRARLGELRQTLASDDRMAARAREVLRSLIDRVDIEPVPDTDVDGRGAGPVRLTVYGRMAELLSLADIPVDRAIQLGKGMETELDDAIVAFTFSFVLPYRNPRRRQTLADVEVVARVLDRVAVPATKQELTKALTDEGHLLDPAESKSTESRLRYALEYLAARRLARAIRIGPKLSGWVWDHLALTDEEWKALAADPPKMLPLPPLKVEAPQASVAVVGRPQVAAIRSRDRLAHAKKQNS